MFQDWGLKCDVTVLSDSSAARGIASRRSLGRTRHVQTRYLWVQERIRLKDIQLETVTTDKNLADVCTKPVPGDVCWKHLHSMGQELGVGRRSEKAKHLAS